MSKNTAEILQKLTQEVELLFESERYKEFLLFMSKFHSYSFFNTLLLMSQMPTLSIPASYTTWKEQGRWVKKGEKALTILIPVTRKVTDEKTGEENIHTAFYARACIFDVSQTEGKPIPSVCERLSGNLNDHRTLDILADISPVPVVYKAIDQPDVNGYFSKETLEICVDSEMSEVMQCKTLVHEIAHAFLHCKGGTEEKADRRTREVQAESISFTVLNYLGIDSSCYSFGYIGGWSKDKTLPELKASMEIIRETSDMIISEIEKRLSENAFKAMAGCLPSQCHRNQLQECAP